MNELSDIPIDINNTTEVIQSPSPALLALLQELRCMLEQLAEQGISDSIDIRSLPFLPGDYEQLETILGEGEINATLNSLGNSQIRETAIPGIWWITHTNSEDEILTELLEVTLLPEILKTPQQDVSEASAMLQQILQQLVAEN